MGSSGPIERLKFAVLYPFHKEPLLGAFGINLLMGFLLAVVRGVLHVCDISYGFPVRFLNVSNI